MQFCFHAAAQSQDLNSNLEPLHPLMGKVWKGKLKAPDGSAEFEVTRTYEVLNKGNVIKCTKTNPGLDNYGEGYFYWDDIEKKIAFFFIEESGVFNRGFVAVEGKTITLEGTMTWPTQANPKVQQSFDFRNSFEINVDGTLTDKWYQNAFGPWMPGHVIEFKPVADGNEFPVLFYSGRDNNMEIYILYPDSKEPVNLTNKPAKDDCPDASPDGKKVIFLSDRSGSSEIFIMNIDGSEVLQLTADGDPKEHPAFSPDGKEIIYIKDFTERTEIWIMNANGTGSRKLTSNQCRDERPEISPDGKKILFMSNRYGNYEIFIMSIDGSDQKRLTNTPYHEAFPMWSPDGKKIAYGAIMMKNGKPEGDIHIMNSDGSGDITITDAPGRDENPAWSPDGKQIIFQSERDGNFEVYLMNADGTNQLRITNNSDWDGWASFIIIGKK